MLIEFEREDNRIFWIAIGCIALSFIVGWFMVQVHDYEGKVCKEKGGVYVTTRYENLCLKKNVVIK